MGELKTKLKSAEERMKSAEAESRRCCSRSPSRPMTDVPVGKDATENVVALQVGRAAQVRLRAARATSSSGAALDILDFARGVRIAGSRSYFLSGAARRTAPGGPAARDRHDGPRAGLHPADRARARAGEGDARHRLLPRRPRAGLPRWRAEETGEDARFLTGTAEVSLTAYQMPEGEVTLTEADLPLKYTAVSTCFRREAGTAGKDTAGLYRVHQFDKCEQVVICRNDVEESKRWHKEMLGYSEEILAAAQPPLPRDPVLHRRPRREERRHVRRGNLDAQPRAAGQADSGYGETHSASRLYDFQARRLNLRYRDKDGKIRFCHTLNNTVVASPRILIPIMEHYQNADGSVTVPEALRKYMNGRERSG